MSASDVPRRSPRTQQMERVVDLLARLDDARRRYRQAIEAWTGPSSGPGFVLPVSGLTLWDMLQAREECESIISQLRAEGLNINLAPSDY